MILVSYRHGLRASELVNLRWDQINFATATLHVRRVKQGTPATHPTRRRTAGLTPATAGAGTEVGIRVHVRT
jgi:integrase